MGPIHHAQQLTQVKEILVVLAVQTNNQVAAEVQVNQVNQAIILMPELAVTVVIARAERFAQTGANNLFKGLARK